MPNIQSRDHTVFSDLIFRGDTPLSILLFLLKLQNTLNQIKEYLDMAIMPLNLQWLEVLRYKPPAGQLQTVTTKTIIEMFREANNFDMTPNEVLIICLLNTVQDKNLMIKVQEQMTEYMDWEKVRNTIIKMDRASHL